MTKSKGVGRGRKGKRRGPRSYGEWLKDTPDKKLCKGPLHPEGIFLPRNHNFFFETEGYFSAPCKECRRYRVNKDKTRKNYGYISISRVKFVFEELATRIGKRETERRLGYGSHKMSRILKGQQQYVEKETFRKAATLLREIRKTGEVRSKREIKHGTHLRRKKSA